MSEIEFGRCQSCGELARFSRGACPCGGELVIIARTKPTGPPPPREAVSFDAAVEYLSGQFGGSFRWGGDDGAARRIMAQRDDCRALAVLFGISDLRMARAAWDRRVANIEAARAKAVAAVEALKKSGRKPTAHDYGYGDRRYHGD